MNKNGLRRYYGRLGPEERFRLDVLAMARGDAAESERLVGSCPKLSYRMNDQAFVGRWTGAIDISPHCSATIPVAVRGATVSITAVDL